MLSLRFDPPATLGLVDPGILLTPVAGLLFEGVPSSYLDLTLASD